ncbi:MAG TPA: hypothetical protein VG245_00575, partial [Candidatus Dormibacteraeota bacterium]|nr:hypothetical protein [Candidatus Dormibacteraeota bacterium]
MMTTAGEGSILSPGEHATSATAGDAGLATADDAEARRLAAVVIEKLRRDPLLLESDPDAESLVSTVV